MTIINATPEKDSIDEKYIDVDIPLIIYSYENEYYEGSGYALCKHWDGKWSVQDIGHCSCYVPEEQIKDVSTGELEKLESVYINSKSEWEKREYEKYLKPCFEKAKEIMNND